MKSDVTLAKWCVMILCCLACGNASAEMHIFGDGDDAFKMEFVTVGNPGNAADALRPLPEGSPDSWYAGAVPYTYSIGKFEVTEAMVQKANRIGDLGITIDDRGPDKPATSVTWFESAAFVNWLNVSSGYSPAYKFDGDTLQLWDAGDVGYSPRNPLRNSLARYVLPNADEWFKAAYHDAAAGTEGRYFSFPDGSNKAPTPVAEGTGDGTAVYHGNAGPADVHQTGALSPYGTMGQGGNVFEWDETEADLINDMSTTSRGLRGGYWSPFEPIFLSAMCRFGLSPTTEENWVGFRVASVPVGENLWQDLNEDGSVNAADAAILIAAWGPQSHSAADYNQDGYVDANDAGQLFAAWTADSLPGSVAAVPEPSGLAGALALWVMLGTRRTRS